jgi:hypothetical protein
MRTNNKGAGLEVHRMLMRLPCLLDSLQPQLALISKKGG